MNQKRNYQRELEQILIKLPEGRRPTLLLQCCCAPCSSYVLEYLSPFFEITAYYYNPNISPKEEYVKRSEELRRFIDACKFSGPVHFEEGPYRPELFFQMAKGLEMLPEGGERCRKCFRLRLEQTGKLAEERGFDWFTTTLSISPLKSAEDLNRIGCEIAEEVGVPYLLSDFKKKNGYKRSVELSAAFGLYRQNYCGCVFSKRDAAAGEKNAGIE